jgi:hypothetical protein
MAAIQTGVWRFRQNLVAPVACLNSQPQ